MGGGGRRRRERGRWGGIQYTLYKHGCSLVHSPCKERSAYIDGIPYVMVKYLAIELAEIWASSLLQDSSRGSSLPYRTLGGGGGWDKARATCRYPFQSDLSDL